MAITSSAALAEITVPSSVLNARNSDDLILTLALKLVSPLQVTVVANDKVPASLRINNNNNSNETPLLLTHRTVILKYLATKIQAFDVMSASMSPWEQAAMTAWISVADSMDSTTNNDLVLSYLEAHLQSHAFLMESSSSVTLADLNLAVTVLLLFNDTATTAVGPNVARWLKTCRATLQRLFMGQDLPFVFDSSSATDCESNGTSTVPVFYNGTEDWSLVLKQATPQPKAEKKPNEVVTQQANEKGVRQQLEKETKQQVPSESKKQASTATPPAAAAPVDFDITAMDICIGKVVKVWHHPESEKLFCQEIDIGSGVVRTIASGLRSYYATEDLLERHVVVIVNLKKRNLAGFASHGMVLCASKDGLVKFIVPPEGAVPGDRVVFGDLVGEPEPESKVAKKKVFEKLAPDLKTNDKGEVCWKGAVAKTPQGILTAELADGQVS
jgi:aminoacyl tRNA synthase complex-interacting multifunctional protein 1